MAGSGRRVCSTVRFGSAGNVARFDIADPFSISTWINADEGTDGSIVTMMQDAPKGKGYGFI